MNRIAITTLILFFGFSFTSLAQFEQKISLNGSIGVIAPIGWSDYLKKGVYYDDNNNPIHEEWIEPYIFPNFLPGAAFSGGIQYNFNRRIGLETKIYTFYLWNWEYPFEPVVYYDEFGDDIQEHRVFTMEYWHFSLGIAPRFYLRPGKKVNPYLIAEVNVSYNDVYLDDNSYIIIEGETEINMAHFDEIFSSEIAAGGMAGIGADISILSNLGMFVQGGYYTAFLGGVMEENGLEWENLNAIRIDAGIKINLLKSKQL